MNITQTKYDYFFFYDVPPTSKNIHYHMRSCQVTFHSLLPSNHMQDSNNILTNQVTALSMCPG